MSAMSRSDFLRWMGAAGLAFATGGCARLSVPGVREKRRPPNLVMILVDDLGWTDLGYAGSKFYKTPNIDRLASQGMVFTDAYAASPLCSPTRASILTGQNPARLHLTQAIVYGPDGKPQDTARAEDKRHAQPWRKVVAPGHVGHLPLEHVTIAEELGRGDYRTAHVGKWHLGTEGFWPEDQGFDVNFGGTHNSSPPSYFYPYRIKNIESGVDGEYLPDRLAAEAEAFIEANRDRPFYLQLWDYAVHTPIRAKEDVIKLYEPEVDPDAGHRNPTYAAMIHSVDDAVGRVMDTLERLGLEEDTFVLFLSDNGALVHEPGSGRYVSSNSPLRHGKATIYEGGIRVPMIARWPGRISAGTVCDVPVITDDIYPTLLEIAGLEPAPGKILDGESLVPLLEESGPLKRDAIHFHFPHYIGGYRPDPELPTYWNKPSSAIRQGDWKLIAFHEGEVELYNLREDIGETNNLADREIKRAVEMRKRLNDWLQETRAWMPVPNPQYDPSVTRIPAPPQAAPARQPAARRQAPRR